MSATDLDRIVVRPIPLVPRLILASRWLQHPDQPEWLSHVNASVLTVKLATAIIGISSIHFAEDIHQCGKLLAESTDRADCDPLHVPAIRHGGGVD